MDSGFGLFKALLPQIPSLTSTAVLHVLGRTPTSAKWDLRTELTIQILRDWMGVDKAPVAVTKAQAQTLKDAGVKGKTWVATEKIPAPAEEGIREAVFQAIEDMKSTGAGALRYTKTDLVDTEVEWTGFRPDAGKDDPLPDLPEEDKYKKLMAEPSRTSETTILYFHGGAYYLCDPITHRLVTSRLAKETHGRVCSVRYRLAPQTAFPGQLLDALMVYLSLIYPPPGSMHDAIPATSIVFAGDSAGGNLSFALLQLLLQFHRSSKEPKLLFHGKEVSVPLPAGACANSGWFDIPLSMPSIETNVKYDYLPSPNHDNPGALRFPTDSAWPTNPLRGDLFCDLSLLDHPLTTLMGADWTRAPPMYLCMGQEMLADEGKLIASQAFSQGVVVQFEDYEAMPHVFAMLLPALPASDRCLRSWGDFCRRCVEGPDKVKTSGTYIHAKTGEEEAVDLNKVSPLTVEDAMRRNRDAKQRRNTAFEKWKTAQLKSSL